MQNNVYKKTGGYLYLLGSGEYIKIGISKHSPKTRIRQLQTGNPQKIKLLKYYRRKDYKELEKFLHKKFRRYRVNGEWFDVKLEQVTRIIEGEKTMLQRIFGFIARLWTALLFLSVIVITLDLFFNGGKILTWILDLLF